VEIYLNEEEKKELGNQRVFFTDKKILVGIHATSGKSAPNLSLTEYRKLADYCSSRKYSSLYHGKRNPG